MIGDFPLQEGVTYLSNITRSASLERRTNPGVPSVRINWIFSLFKQKKKKKSEMCAVDSRDITLGNIFLNNKHNI